MSDGAGGRLAAVGEALMILVFRLGDTVVGLDANQVEEIAPLPAIAPVRGAPEWVLGVGNLRNRIVTIVDPGLRLGLAPATAGPSPRIVMTSIAGAPVAMVVPGLPDVVEAEASALRPLDAEIDEGLRGLFSGGVDRGDSMIAVLDPAVALAPPAPAGRRG